MNAPKTHARHCPQCHAGLLRVRRRFADRLLSMAAPLARYRCSAFSCGWEGLFVRGMYSTGRLPRDGDYRPNRVLEPSRSAVVGAPGSPA